MTAHGENPMAIDNPASRLPALLAFGVVVVSIGALALLLTDELLR